MNDQVDWVIHINYYYYTWYLLLLLHNGQTEQQVQGYARDHLSDQLTVELDNNICALCISW